MNHKESQDLMFDIVTEKSVLKQDVFNNVKYIGTKKLTSKFLKKIISWRIFRIKIKEKKNKLAEKIFLKKEKIIFFLYVKIIFYFSCSLLFYKNRCMKLRK